VIRRILPAIGLFFLAPLVAEYLLGDFPLTHMGPLLFLAPMYGGGALLIREIVRRSGRGWPTIMVLALAYGILEEAFMTQTLFNPNYLGMLHTVWSVSVPIGLVEAMVPERSREPWLRTPGIVVVAGLFTWIAIASAVLSVRQDRAHFVASRPQFTWAAIIFVLTAAGAFLLPKLRQRQQVPPNVWIVGAFGLIASSLFLLIPPQWGWKAFWCEIALEVTAIAVIVFWSRSTGWSNLHRLALAGGAALSYAWHGFIQNPVVGNGGISMRIGNAVLAAGLVVLLAVAARRVRASTVPTSGSQIPIAAAPMKPQTLSDII
jgi:hypothetical protein